MEPSDSTSPETTKEDPSYSIPPRPDVEPPQEPVLTGDEATDAVEVATYFVLLYPYVLKTADANAWQEMSSAECEFCSTVIEQSESRKETGEWADGELELVDFRVFQVETSPSEYVVAILVGRTGVVDYQVDEAKRVEDGIFTVVVDVDGASSWEVINFEIAEESAFEMVVK